MKCYYHPEVDAVGLCKHCQRGLCTGCAAEVGGDGLACRARHEAQVQVVNELMAKAPRAYQNQARSYGALAALFLVLGVLGALAALMGLITADWGLALSSLVLAGAMFFVAARMASIGRRDSLPAPKSAPQL